MRLTAFKLAILSLLSILVFITIQYRQENHKTTPPPQNVTLHFGQQGIEDFNSYTGGKIDKQPAGMSFYDLYWTPPNLGTVNIVNDKNIFTLNHVFSVLGSRNNDYITSIDIDAGLNQAEFVNSKEAYLAYKNLMTQINQQGWQNYYYHFEPHIAKKDNLKFIQQYHTVIDPSYILSYEEWLGLFNGKIYQSLYYNLYLDGIILGITLEKTGANEVEQEQYICIFLSTYPPVLIHVTHDDHSF
ncbi:hypothetical protein [Psychrobacter sp. I-STPA6b]|uniref:hypothetical protein n=1 Tax=Psychrobacter sp. I-STPA6b TaxID=2585718 RepID=UPI001D0CBF2D|nr:hypothetical protein [Psychrobacter sp. I-STPA6b]